MKMRGVDGGEDFIHLRLCASRLRRPWSVEATSAAGPRGSKGFEGKQVEGFVKSSRPSIDVGDDNPDQLLGRHLMREVQARLPREMPIALQPYVAPHEGDPADCSRAKAGPDVGTPIQCASAERHCPICTTYVLRRRCAGKRECRADQR